MENSKSSCPDCGAEFNPADTTDGKHYGPLCVGAMKWQRDDARRQHDAELAAKAEGYEKLREIRAELGKLQLLLDFAESPPFTRRRLKAERDAAISQLDAERGKAALIMEAFWLAIADLPHADECPVATCAHEVECPHVAVDCTCEECSCACSCWRAVADKALDVDEAVQLCTRLRDAEDTIEELRSSTGRATS